MSVSNDRQNGTGESLAFAFALKLSADRRIEAVAPGNPRLGQDVSGDGGAYRRTAEAPFHRTAFHVQGEHGKYIPVGNLVVPRGTGAVVAVIVAPHAGIIGEPGGVVVDAVAGGAGGGGAGFASRSDLGGMAAGGNLAGGGGEVHQHPMEEVHPDRKSTRLNSSHHAISYAGFC